VGALCELDLGFRLERATRIELAFSAWEADWGPARGQRRYTNQQVIVAVPLTVSDRDRRCVTVS